MSKGDITYIPVITTKAGNCLTYANWQEIGITKLSYQLAHLFLKPGLAFLQKLFSLKSYSGWYGEIVLNAQLSFPSGQTRCMMKSPYDGSKIEISMDQMRDTIIQLQPDVVLLPDFYLHDWSKHKSILLKESIKETSSHNVRDSFNYYLMYTSAISLTHNYELPACCISLNEDLELNIVADIIRKEAIYPLWVETDLPAYHALSAKVYHQGCILNLLHPDNKHRHVVIDSCCSCPVCRKKLTRSYLHHLFAQVPLLCQRLLIQHNAYYFSNYLQSL